MALCCRHWCCCLFNDIPVLLMIELIQCSMCKAVLESGADEKTAESLNDGIIYLMAIPYILAAITAYVIYIKFFKKSKPS